MSVDVLRYLEELNVSAANGLEAETKLTDVAYIL
jgi:hypothetical protein